MDRRSGCQDFANEHPYLGEVTRAEFEQFRLDEQTPVQHGILHSKPHRFVQIAGTAKNHSLAVAKSFSERRPYIPVTIY